MYRKNTKSWFKHWDFLLLDLVCLQIAFLAAYFIRMGFGNPYLTPVYRNMAVFVELIDIVVLLLSGSLHGIIKRGRLKEFTVTLKHTVIVGLVSVLYLFATQTGASYSRIVLFIMVGIYFILGYFVRILWKEFLKKRSRDASKRSLFIITASDMAKEAVRNIKEKDFSTRYIAGIAVMDKDMTGQKIDDVEVAASRSDVISYICRQWVDEVLIVSSPNFTMPEGLIGTLSETGIVIHIEIPVTEELNYRKQQIENVGGYTVLTSTMNFITPAQMIAKRALDIAGGLIGSLLALLIMLFIGPAIYIKSPGPILFKQVRIGQNGKKFTMYKLRSMYLDAEERKKEFMDQNRIADGMMFKLEFDPRVIGNEILPDGTKKTGIGEFIRKNSLDEFPQFFNVLKGDMSLVGTRPPTLDEWEKYELRHRARLAIKPGITGMWQASGRSEITDFEEVVALDTQYINEWTPGLDFKILFKTVKNVLTHKGAM